MSEDDVSPLEPEVSSLRMRGPHIAVVLALTGLFGCSDECDCPLGVPCDADGECQLACTQDSDCDPLPCAAGDECCSGLAICSASECVAETVPDQFCGPPPEISDGWQAAPGSGEVYLLTNLEVATECPDETPCTNALAGLRVPVDEGFRLALWGAPRILFDVAGRELERPDFDRSVTLRVVLGRDADEPPNPHNDFGPVGDSPDCCDFAVDPDAVPGQQDALIELPGRVRRNRLSVDDRAPSIVLPLSLSAAGHFPLTLYGARLELSSHSPSGIFDAVDIRGTVRPYDLWQVPASFCIGASPSEACPRGLPEGATFLDALVAAAGAPDVDGDGDGLECLLDTDDDGGIDRCCEGGAHPECDSNCAPIPPVHMSAVSSCALSDALADTYSVGLRGRLIPATLVSNR